MLQHSIVAIVSLFVFYHAFLEYEWYIVLAMSILFFIIAALLITVVQLGIFMDGKPLIGMHRVYKSTPYLVILIVICTLSLWMSK